MKHNNIGFTRMVITLYLVVTFRTPSNDNSSMFLYSQYNMISQTAGVAVKKGYA